MRLNKLVSSDANCTTDGIGINWLVGGHSWRKSCVDISTECHSTPITFLYVDSGTRDGTLLISSNLEKGKNTYKFRIEWNFLKIYTDVSLRRIRDTLGFQSIKWSKCIEWSFLRVLDIFRISWYMSDWKNK